MTSKAIKRVVVTGASSGIGAATAVAFAQQGARLVLAARGRAGLDDIAERSRAAGGEAHVRVVDVTDAGAVAQLAAEAREHLGEIDVWFSNVGVGVVGRYEDVPIAEHAPRIHVCDVYPTFVDTPGIDHAANYTGAKLSLPPGALAPETVAKAVVRLADRPRNTTAVGAPPIPLKLNQFFAPNLGAATMNGFMDCWTSKADPGGDGSGALCEPPATPSGIDGGRRRPDQRGKAAAATGAGVAALGLVTRGAFLWRCR